MAKLTDSYFFAIDVLEELEGLLTNESMILVKAVFVYYFCKLNEDDKRAEYFNNIIKEDKTDIKKEIIEKNYELAKLSGETEGLKLDGKKIITVLDEEEYEEDLKGKSKEDIKKYLEEEGYTCK
jgi:hypothetical protein